MMATSPQEVIRFKRDGLALSAEQIRDFVRGVSQRVVSDAQVASFAMATFLQGLSREETVALTLALRDSGQRLRWDDLILDGPVVDKHSTGGVGDWSSLALAPMLAACGAYVPMISGRGLGHTGGTIDKLESISGFNANQNPDALRALVKTNGLAIVAQSQELAPADRVIYAVRDVTATVESTPLIASSIVSKKLAAGVDHLVLDVKTGSGATTGMLADAQRLALLMSEICNEAGCRTRAVVSDMSHLISYSAGNALEIREVVDLLTDTDAHPRQLELILRLGSELLMSSGLADDMDAASRMLMRQIESGRAAERFNQMIAAQGGPSGFIERIDQWLKPAPVSRALIATRSGYVVHRDVRAIGDAVVALGGGRAGANSVIDHRVGLSAICAQGERVSVGDELLRVHAADQSSCELALARMAKNVLVSESVPDATPLFYPAAQP